MHDLHFLYRLWFAILNGKKMGCFKTNCIDMANFPPPHTQLGNRLTDFDQSHHLVVDGSKRMFHKSFSPSRL